MSFDFDPFNPRHDDRPRSGPQAFSLMLAWAEGRRSWVNQVHADTPARKLEVVAVVDAAEVFKWAVVAIAYEARDAARRVGR